MLSALPVTSSSLQRIFRVTQVEACDDFIKGACRIMTTCFIVLCTTVLFQITVSGRPMPVAQTAA